MTATGIAGPATVIAGVALAAGLSLGCSATPGSPPEAGAAPGSDLTVFAAASLRDVLAELAPAWEARHPGSRLVVAVDGSNILASQIAEGAPADVFVSADLEQAARLVEQGLAEGAPVVFARSGLALVAPARGGPLVEPEDLAAPGLRLVAAGRGVPISRYADEALRRLAATMPRPEAFLAAVEANVVSREDNVRAVLAKVELGEGDAAIVYRTDALGSEAVRVVPLPAAVDVSAEYAALTISTHPLAAELVAWLLGPEAAEVLAEAGFEVAAA